MEPECEKVDMITVTKCIKKNKQNNAKNIYSNKFCACAEFPAGPLNKRCRPFNPLVIPRIRIVGPRLQSPFAVPVSNGNS